MFNASIMCRTGKDELLETAMALHEAAMKDEYFIKRKLAPNVDFWYVFLLSFAVIRFDKNNSSIGGKILTFINWRN